MTRCERVIQKYGLGDVSSKRWCQPSSTSVDWQEQFLNNGRDSRVEILLFPEDGQFAFEYKQFRVFPSQIPAEGGAWLVSCNGLDAPAERQLLEFGCELLPDWRLCVRIGNSCQWGQRIPWRIAKLQEHEYREWPREDLLRR